MSPSSSAIKLAPRPISMPPHASRLYCRREHVTDTAGRPQPLSRQDTPSAHVYRRRAYHTSDDYDNSRRANTPSAQQRARSDIDDSHAISYRISRASAQFCVHTGGIVAPAVSVAAIGLTAKFLIAERQFLRSTNNAAFASQSARLGCRRSNKLALDKSACVTALIHAGLEVQD